MKILVITHLFYPDRGGGASVFSDMCFGLVKRGHDVDVFATYPYYPEWRNKSGVSEWKVTQEIIEGVNVTRYGLYIPKNPSRLWERVLYEISFSVSLLRSLTNCRRYDLTMVYCPLMGSLLFAVLRKWLVGGRLWLNVQDIPADAAEASGISKNRLFNKLASGVQQFLFRQPEDVSTISPVMVNRVAAIVNDGRSPIYLPNWLNSSMEKWIKELECEKDFSSAETRQLLYAGNIGKKQGLLTLCRRMAEWNINFKFRIQADGGEAGKLRDWVRSKDDSRFEMGGFLPEEGFVKALYETDYFLITETENVGASFIPSKLIPCISTGTPVIAVCDPEGPLGTEVRENNLGYVIEWNELQILKSILSKPISGDDSYLEMRKSCLSRSKFYRQTQALDTIEARLKDG